MKNKTNKQIINEVNKTVKHIEEQVEYISNSDMESSDKMAMLVGMLALTMNLLNIKLLATQNENK